MSKKANKLIEGCLVRFADPAALVASRRTGSSYFSVPQLCTSGGLPSNAAQSTTTRAGAQGATREECRQGRQRAGARKGLRILEKARSSIRRAFRYIRGVLRELGRPDHVLSCVVPSCEASEIERKATILRKSATGSTTALITRGDFRAWARRFLSRPTAEQVLRTRSLPEILWCRIDPLDRRPPAEGASLLIVSSFALPSTFQCQFPCGDSIRIPA